MLGGTGAHVEGFEPVPENAVVLLGARDLDPGEETALARSKVVRLSAHASTIGLEPVLQSLKQEIAQCYLHFDLDALDPTEGRANSYSARGGFSRANVQHVLATIAKQSASKSAHRLPVTIPLSTRMERSALQPSMPSRPY